MSYWTENEDKLGRAEESAYIVRFLSQQVSNRIARGKTGSYVLNIDATWGEGKSFFMKGLFADLKKDGHPAIMIDAWRDDFSDDPLTAVVAEFDNFLNSFKSADKSIKTKVKAAGKDFRRNVGKLSLLTAKGIAKRATTYVVGEAADEVAQAAKELVSSDVKSIVDDATGAVIKFTDTKIDKFAENKLAQFNQAKTSLDNFQTSLASAVVALTAKEFAPPFFILVDELDRCRPTYAIEMLERIKHLFEVENVVFVLATDTTQLANSIKAVYGSEFDSRHYLARFFDRTYMLAAPKQVELIAYLVKIAGFPANKISTMEMLDIVDLIVEVSKSFRMELRQISRAIDLLEIIVVAWVDSRKLELSILFPMICAFLKGNSLVSRRDVQDVFMMKREGFSSTPVTLNKCNLSKTIEIIFQPYRVDEAAHRAESDMANPNWISRDRGEKLGHTIRVRERNSTENTDQFTIILTYAERIRMAGRFTDES